MTTAPEDSWPEAAAAELRTAASCARYRRSDRTAELIEPGAVLEYAIDLAATSYLFARGHRLRLEVSSSIFGRCDRNPNSGGPFGLDTMGSAARQDVHHGRAYPSRITLPVIPPGAGARVPAAVGPLPD